MYVLAEELDYCHDISDITSYMKPFGFGPVNIFSPTYFITVFTHSSANCICTACPAGLQSVVC